MRDPARDAAFRVFKEYCPERGEFEFRFSADGDFGIDVAREALAPLRDLHRKVPIHVHEDDCENPEHEDYYETTLGEFVCDACPPVGWTCAECVEFTVMGDECPEWPCDTAKRIYPEDEW